MGMKILLIGWFKWNFNLCIKFEQKLKFYTEIKLYDGILF